MNISKMLRLATIFVVLSIFNACNDPVEDINPAEFAFKENLAVKYGDLIPLKIAVLEKNIDKIELVVNDSIFKTWQHPTGQLSYDLEISPFGLGTKTLKIEITMENGEVYFDQRLLRVLSDITPEKLTAKIISRLPHNATDFTQGLEFNDGILYESTGDPQGIGATIVSQKNLQTGAIVKKAGLDATYFGEGITILNNNVYQITWTQQKCFIYDKTTLNIQPREFNYTGEGWGLCNDGKYIIMSDGSERIVFRNPETFQVVKSIEVYDEFGPRGRLNELEYIDGKIYANVWMLDIVLVIDPLSGRVLAEIDASDLAIEGKNGGDVLNGIAYNPQTKKIYMTGKFWTKMFEVKFE